MGAEMLIADEPGLVIVALLLGCVLGWMVDVIRRRSGVDDPSVAIPIVVLLGQAILVCAVWIAFEVGSITGSSRRYFLRYELGWVAIIAAVAVLAAMSWRRRHRLSRSRIALGLGMLSIIGAQALSAWSAGFAPRVEIYAPILFIIVALALFPLSMNRAIDISLAALGAVCVVSVTAAVLDLTWSQTYEIRRIPAPFVDGRLKGVVAHPNVLAPLASIGVLLAAADRRRGVRWLLGPVCAVALWWTDGRTQIAATLAVLAGWALVVALKRIELASVRRWIIVAIGAAASIGALIFIAGQGASEVRTLNGRTRLWEDAVDYWQSSPLVGVGPEAFGEQYRLESGLRWAYGAHNQIMQTLAAEGIIGLISLVVTLMVFVGIAASATGRRKIQLSLIGFIALATMMVETPFWLELYLPEWFLFISIMILLFSARPDDENERGSVSS